jgi:hypothetical protein
VAGAAGVDDGRYAGADAENIRIRAKRAQAGHQVQMNVDQSGRDDEVLDVDHGCTLDLEIRSNRRYYSVAHPDVEARVSAVGWIEHLPAFQDVVGRSAFHLLVSLFPKLERVKGAMSKRIALEGFKRKRKGSRC